MYNCSSIEEGKVVRLSDVRSITYQVKSYNGNDENPPRNISEGFCVSLFLLSRLIQAHSAADEVFDPVFLCFDLFGFFENIL